MTDTLNAKIERHKMISTATRRAVLLVTLIAAGCLIAACGSSSSTASSSKTTSSGNRRSANATLTACLREHGVSLPTGNGVPGGGTPPSVSGGPPASAGSTTGGAPSGFPGGGAGGSKFQAALKACGAKLPSATGPRSTGLSPQAIQKYVTCVGQHGYKLPTPNLTGKGPVFRASIRANAKFQAASRSCQSLLTPATGSRAASKS